MKTERLLAVTAFHNIVSGATFSKDLDYLSLCDFLKSLFPSKLGEFDGIEILMPVHRENSSSSRRESQKTCRVLVENQRKLVEFSSRIRENSSSSRRESQKTRRVLVENQRKLVEFSSRIRENSSSSRRESEKTRRVLVGFLSRKIFLDILGMELVSTIKKLNLWYA